MSSLDKQANAISMIDDNAAFTFGLKEVPHSIASGSTPINVTAEGFEYNVWLVNNVSRNVIR